MGLPTYIYGILTPSAQGILNRYRPPDGQIEPLFDTTHLGRH